MGGYSSKKKADEALALTLNSHCMQLNSHCMQLSSHCMQADEALALPPPKGEGGIFHRVMVYVEAYTALIQRRQLLGSFSIIPGKTIR